MDLLNRALLRLDGKDGLELLQKLTTQDLTSAAESHYTLLLTPQGRYAFDFFVINTNGVLYIDVAAHCADALITALNKYKLRSDVTIERVLPASVDVSLAPDACSHVDALACFRDPRHPSLGCRIWRPIRRFSDSDVPSDYKKILTECDIVEPSHEMKAGEDLPLEFGLHKCNAISFSKGCFLGQEVTSRTHHKGLIKNEITHLDADHVLAIGTPVHNIHNDVVGTVIRTVRPLALLQIKVGLNVDEGLIIAYKKVMPRMRLGSC